MKLPSYTATRGLDRYPELERFAVYRATHKRLMSENATYHRQWASYVAGIVCVSVVPVGFVGGGAFGISLSVVLMTAAVAGAIFLAFRQQMFMNARIGDALQHQAT